MLNHTAREKVFGKTLCNPTPRMCAGNPCQATAKPQVLQAMVLGDWIVSEVHDSVPDDSIGTVSVPGCSYFSFRLRPRTWGLKDLR